MQPFSFLAGMPTLRLTEMGSLRLQSISFFLLVFFLSAWGVMGLWNYLSRDFARLPRIKYRHALGIVALWGMLFVLILTMISGARELLTPGAWEREGYVSKVVSAKPEDQTIWNNIQAARRDRLEALQRALWAYAYSHGGQFPPDDREPSIPPALWETPDVSRARYAYVPGRRADVGRLIVAYEPVALEGRLALMSDGTIVRIGVVELEKQLAGDKP